MSEMKKLAGLVRELEDQLAVCMRCGMCQAVCPVFAETGRESDVARGKLALLDGILREMLKDAEGVNDRLMRCLLCGSCAANCPSGVKALDLFLKARAILAGYRGLSPLKKTLFRGMLAHPALFDRLMEWGASLQNVFVKPASEQLGTSCGRLFSPLIGERHVKGLAREPFHQRVTSLDKPAGKSGLRVGLFVGCLVDKIFPEVAEAMLAALDHHGVGIFLAEGLGCCGIPALASGDAAAFSTLVRHNLQKLTSEPFDYLVTGCATCTATIKKHWPSMAQGLSEPEAAGVKALAERTLDISQFLVDKVRVADALEPAVDGALGITYHDPCHLKKSLGVSAQPRLLVRRNRLYQFKEMAEPDRCCGCGGSFNVRHYDLSASIGRHKRENVVRSGCEVVATSCPACMLQLLDLLSQAGDRVRVKHAIEIYAEALTEE